MIFKLLGNIVELLVDLGHTLLQPTDRLGGTHTSYHILTLSIDQILTKDLGAAIGRVAREGHTRRRVITHVPEDHRLDIHTSTEVISDLVDAPIVTGTSTIPGAEHSGDRRTKLLLGILREIDPSISLDDLLEGLGNLNQLGSGEIGVLTLAMTLRLIQHMLKALTFNAEHNLPEELDKTSVGICGKARILCQQGHSIPRSCVEAQVQYRVHHARHRELRTRAYRHEEWVGGITKCFARLRLNILQRLQGLLPKPIREGATNLVVGVTSLRRNREPWRYRNPGACHLRNTGALATKQVAHCCITLTKQINPFFAHEQPPAVNGT